jgi:probable HAF family extracellular repeat protein
MSSKYDITDLGTLGGTESFAYALNDPGQVVGSSRLPGDTATHAFLYEKGSMKDLSPLNSGNTQTVGPTGINNSGQIASGVIAGESYSAAIYDSKNGQTTHLGSFGGVTSGGLNGVATSVNNSGKAVGYSYLDSLNRHAFLYSGGPLTDMGSFGGYSSATCINDGGDIVGFSSTTVTGSANAFLYRNGALTNISPFGSSESYARGINNGGEVVGQFLISDKSAFHAFLYRKGAVTDIHGLGTNSDAVAINNAGAIVGHVQVKVGTALDPVTGQPRDVFDQHAFVYVEGVMADLNNLIQSAPNWVLKWAFSINNRGQIVGYGELNGKNRAYLLTPAHR